MDEQVLIDVVKGLSSAKRIVISLDAGKTGWIVKICCKQRRELQNENPCICQREKRLHSLVFESLSIEETGMCMDFKLFNES